MTVLSKILVCGNVPSKADENTLYELFLQFGPVDEVTLDTRSQVAVIIFKYSESVQYSIDALIYTRLYGNIMTLYKGTDVENDFRTVSDSPNILQKRGAPDNTDEDQIGSSSRSADNPTGRYMHKPDSYNPISDVNVGWGELRTDRGLANRIEPPYSNWGAYASSHINLTEYQNYCNRNNFNYYKSPYDRHHDNERNRQQDWRYERGNWWSGDSSNRYAGHSNDSRYPNSRSYYDPPPHDYHTNQKRDHSFDMRDVKRSKRFHSSSSTNTDFKDDRKRN